MGCVTVLLALALMDGGQAPASKPNASAPAQQPAAQQKPATPPPPAAAAQQKPPAPAPAQQPTAAQQKPATPPAQQTPPAAQQKPPAPAPQPPPSQPGSPAASAPKSTTPQPAAGQTPAAAQPAAPPPPVETYTYRAEGRRDPFQSLLLAGGNVAAGHKGEGPSGMTLGEISVRGVLQSRGALIAMIQGPDNKTYIVHQGDKLLDGTIKTITPQGLVVVQEVNDPLSLVKQREIRKLLRSLEDAK